MQKGLVSLISPCYNGESYIRYFLDSLLIQDYRPIEVFIVDDGSTDKTYEIAISYIEKFKEKGIDYTVLKQGNQGAASAINKALPLIKGEFFTWPDSDDLLYFNNISKKVEALRNDKQANIVICNIDVVNENNFDKIIGRLKVEEENLVYNIINFINAYYTPIGFMVRTECLFNTYKDKHIVKSDNRKIGQNMQIILPCLLNSNYQLIDNSLGKYIVRGKSHSRQKLNFKEMQEKNRDIEKLFFDIIDKMHLADNIELYNSYVKESITRLSLNLYFQFEKKQEFNNIYKNLIEQRLKTDYKKQYLMLNNILFKCALNFADRLKRRFS